MKFAYNAFDRAGRKIASTVEGAGLLEASESLRRQGLFVSQINPVEQAPSSPQVKRRRWRLGAGQRLRNAAVFARQLHVLVSSGTPLVQALCAIERQCESQRWRPVVVELRKRVEEGSPLSHAMRSQPQAFDPVAVSLVAAGEASGALTQMLDRLASLLRKQLQLRHGVIGALIYPCVLIVMGIGVLVLMLLFVLPRFAILFEALDSPLPPTTQLLLWFSEMLRTYWWVLALLAMTMGFGIRFWVSRAAGRRALHRLALTVPRAGRLVRSLMTARLARMLGVLLESRVSLIEALQLTQQSMVNLFYAELLVQAEDAVSRGDPVSAVLSESDLVSACVQEAIRHGEASGQLGTPLVQMADFLDEENEIVVKSITRLLEPAILAALGLIVGIIAISMFLPLFDLVASAHGGG